MHYSTCASILATLLLTSQAAAEPQFDSPQFRSVCSRWPEFRDQTITAPPGPAVTITTTKTVPVVVMTTITAYDVFTVKTEFTSTTTKLGGTTTLYTFPDTTPAPRMVRVKREAAANAPLLQERGLFDSVTRRICSGIVHPTTSTYIPPAPTTSVTVTAIGQTITQTTIKPGSTTVSTTSIVSTVIAPAATTTVAACGKLDNLDWNQSYGVTWSTLDIVATGSGLECCKKCYSSNKGCDMWLFSGSSCWVYSGGNFGNGRVTDSANCPFGRDNADYGVSSSNTGGYAGAGPCGDH